MSGDTSKVALGNALQNVRNRLKANNYRYHDLLKRVKLAKEEVKRLKKFIKDAYQEATGYKMSADIYREQKKELGKRISEAE